MPTNKPADVEKELFKDSPPAVKRLAAQARKEKREKARKLWWQNNNPNR